MAFGKTLPIAFAGLVSFMWASTATLAQPAPPADAPPFTCLFDSVAASASALNGEALTTRKGWLQVAEDKLVHTFGGDVVCANDRVALVLRRNGGGAEIYSKTAGVWKQRTVLRPLCENGPAVALSSLKIIENSQAAVMLEAAFIAKESGPAATLQLRMTAGESLLDVRGAKGASKIRVCDQAQYVVVPDFFADDMVFDPATIDRSRTALPADNSVLGLSDAGNAIVACVWPSSRQNVDLLMSGDGSSRKIAGCEIDLAENNRMWIAVMAGAGIWHAQRLTAVASDAELSLEWKAPMPAHWRADFVDAEGTSASCYFADAEMSLMPTIARSVGVCRFDGGRALVRMVDSAVLKSPRLVAIYPIERTRATPLTTFCLVDIMRNALGFGPCQYVLDAEGLGGGESPTPEQVTHWVEKQFEKKASKRDVDVIREQLNNMTLQVKRTDERIALYAAFAAKVKHECKEYSGSPAQTAAVNRLAAIAQSMETAAGEARPTVDGLAATVSSQADRDDALANAQPSLIAIRAAGANQDYTLARLRMAVRRLKQECRTMAAEGQGTAQLAARVQQQADQLLTKK